MKTSIFDEQTSKALTKWHKNALKKKGEGVAKARSPTKTVGGSPIDSPVDTPANDINGGPFPPRRAATAADGVMSDMEANASSDQHTANIMATVDLQGDQPPPPNNSSSSNNNAFQYGSRNLIDGP